MVLSNKLMEFLQPLATYIHTYIHPLPLLSPFLNFFFFFFFCFLCLLSSNNVANLASVAKHVNYVFYIV